MEKKYYDIIVSLIKQNDKFIGCEPILEDIIEDVYAHSKIVLGSVTNEDVIAAYLKKVVATSLITVPKKLNFNIKQKHRIISNVQAITNIDIQKPSIEEPSDSSQEELAFENETISELSELKIETPEAVENIQIEETIPEAVEFEQEIPQSDLTLSFVEEFEQDEPDTEEEVSLIESMNESTEPESESEEAPEITESLSSSIDAIETIEENDSDILSFDISEEDTALAVAAEEEEFFANDSSEIQEETVEIDTLETLQEEDTPFLQASIIEESEEEGEEATPNIDKTLVDKMINGLSAAETDENTDNQLEANENDDSLQISFDSNDEIILAEDPLSENDFSLEAPAFEELASEEEPIINEIIEESHNIESAVKEVSNEIVFPDYNCFNYEPEAIEFAEEEICSDLIAYNTKHPDKKLLEICQLKYKENLSVSEIAEALEFSEETVLEVLNDIIELVKD